MGILSERREHSSCRQGEQAINAFWQLMLKAAEDIPKNKAEVVIQAQQLAAQLAVVLIVDPVVSHLFT